ncbi:MAG: hypothetical protein MUC31_05120, partial [Bacteroidales bacterium]|nr:hypothetical protein [Bacteroidales bacterium]
MKNVLSVIFVILSCITSFLHAGSTEHVVLHHLARTDSIPPPPFGEPNLLSGLSSACVGDTCEYETDVPVACTCQWSVNGVIQPETSSLFVITWTEPGIKEISVVFICQGGQISDPQTLSVTVGVLQPGPVTGESPVCEFTYHTYSTSTGPEDSCQWTVNGVIQPGYLPEITYSFGAAGLYLFEVVAFNSCGESPPQILEVTAQGTAPDPPSPIQGAESSCEGNDEVYTTTVGAGETCEWKIDGVIQPTSSTILETTWNERGTHLIEARAVSSCGTGNPAIKDVLVLYDPFV